MTEKQEKILAAAALLFGRDGFHATSTSKVAKQAGVSEGLIFRHYGNKEGLLQAVIDDGTERFKAMFSSIVMESDPTEVIRKCLLMPFDVKESEYEFWKLQFKLKWEFEQYNNEKMEPLHMALTNAFSKLNYEKPEMEAELLLLVLDGLASAILKDTLIDKESMKRFLLQKYEL